MKGEQRLRSYLQGTQPGQLLVGPSVEGFLSSGGALDQAAADCANAIVFLNDVITQIAKKRPSKEALGTAGTGEASYDAIDRALKSLRERKRDLQSVAEALGIAAGGISYGHQSLTNLPVATDPGPKPPNPVNTNDWDPVQNMRIARWTSQKAAYDQNPEVRDKQADAAADVMDTQFQSALDKIDRVTVPKAPTSPGNGGDGGSTGSGTGADAGGPTPTSTRIRRDPTHTDLVEVSGPATTTSIHHPTDQTTHHATTQTSHQTATTPTGGGAYADGDGTRGVLDTGSGYTPSVPGTTDLSTASMSPGSGVAGGGLGKVGGSMAAGGLGAAGLGLGLRTGGLGGLGGIEPSLSTSAVSRGVGNANALGASSRTGGSAVTGRGGAGAGRGAGAGGTHTGRGGKDKKRNGAFNSYDDGSDWVEEEDAGPGVLR